MAVSGFLIRILFLAIPGILGSKLYKKFRGRPAREMWETFIEILVFSLAAYAIVNVLGWDRSDGNSSPMTVQATPPFTVQSPEPIPFVGPPSFSIPATQPTTILPQPGLGGRLVALQIIHPVTIATTQPVFVDGTTMSVFAIQPVTIQPANTGMPSSSIFQAILNEQVSIGGYVKTILLATIVSLLLAIIGAYIHNFGLVNWVGRKIYASKRSGDEDTWSYFNNSDQVQWVFVRDFSNNRVYYGAVGQYSDSDQVKEIVLNDVQVFSIDKDELLYCVEALFLSRDHDNWTIEVPGEPAKN